jgi:hypothetical protein
MQCDFCHQDVAEPCRDADMIHARAIEHVERCEDAEKAAGFSGDGELPGVIIPPTVHQ